VHEAALLAHQLPHNADAAEPLREVGVSVGEPAPAAESRARTSVEDRWGEPRATTPPDS